MATIMFRKLEDGEEAESLCTGPYAVSSVFNDDAEVIDVCNNLSVDEFKQWLNAVAKAYCDDVYPEKKYV